MHLGLPLVLLCFTLADPAPAQWSPRKTGTEARLRGVHAVDEKVVWASGTKGTFLVTTDSGETWNKGTVPGAEELDFRDVHAFGSRKATLLASGPGPLSQLFQTEDSGKTWTRRYTNIYPKGFLDAIAFWDESRGIVLGDPLDGRFATFLTEDGGKTWHRGPLNGMPAALPDEGAFAASGTCLIVQGKANAWFATGGAKVSRVFRTTDGGRRWDVSETPVRAGNPSTGIFSIAFRDAKNGIAVGGDYKVAHAPGPAIARTTDGGLTWKTIAGGPNGYRSAVAAVPGAPTPTWIASGPTGSDASIDDGETWKPIQGPGFHAVSATGLNAIWAVGDDGKVSWLSGVLK